MLVVHFYGIPSSGGLCVAAVKKIKELTKEAKLEIIVKVFDSAYVDDCNSSVSTMEEALELKNNMPKCMINCEFPIKGIVCCMFWKRNSQKSFRNQ